MGKNNKFWATTTTPDVVVLQSLPLLGKSGVVVVLFIL